MVDRMKEIVEKLKGVGAKKVFVQFPEGLRLRIQEIARELERNGFEIVLCCEPCYGACDIRDREARLLGCDSILHIGHESLGIESELPVVFWEYFLEKDPIPLLEKELSKLENFKRIGLLTSIQFVKLIPKVKSYLEQKGKKVFVHKALQFPGQVLGCRLEAALEIEEKVDCFVCISAGKFYGLGIVLKTSKPVFNLDLEKGKIESLTELKRKIEKIKAWNKAQFKDAKKVGILVSWKKGQLSPNPFQIKEKVEKMGKEAFILAFDEITPEKIEGLKLDALLNTACPRIGIDDLGRYKIPLLNLEDLDE